VPASVFSGPAVKLLKNILKFKDDTTFSSTTAGYLSNLTSDVQAQLAQGSAINGNNRDFEVSIGDWVTYADAAGVNPVDGTGGSPNVTFTRTTTNGEVLQGTASAKLAKDAANRQGQGASLTITPSLSQRGKPNKISFSYSASANFDYGASSFADPSDIIVQAYDATSGALLHPHPGYLNASGVYEGLVHIPTTCTSVRIILHIATTNASAWDFFADDFKLSVAPNVESRTSSDWASYTPTFTAFGTVSVSAFRWRIEGPDLIIQGQFTAGTTTTSEPRVSLPNNFAVATTVTSGNQKIGHYIRGPVSGADTAHGGNLVAVAGNTYFNFSSRAAFAATSTSSNLVDVTTNAQNIATSSDVISLEARIPVQGLTSGYAHPAQIGLNPEVIMQAYKSAGNVTANTTIAAWDAPGIDTTDSFNETTGVYTVKSPGTYSVTFAIDSSAGNGTRTNVMLNGVNVYGHDPIATAGTGITNIMPPVVLPNLKYGDLITVELNANLTIAATAIKNWICIYKIGGSAAQPYIPRVCYIKDVKAANTAGGTATSGSFQTRTLNTLEGDQSFVSLASNQFTLQPGTYEIEAFATVYAVGNSIAKLRNTTDGSDVLTGTVATSVNASPADVASRVYGSFSISTAKTFEIQHNVQSTQATNGWGSAPNLGVSNTFTVVKLRKVL
jgi:hypothetical protein